MYTYVLFTYNLFFYNFYSSLNVCMGKSYNLDVFFMLSQVWLGKTLQKLDSLLLGVCQEFKDEGYINVSLKSLSYEMTHYF